MANSQERRRRLKVLEEQMRNDAQVVATLTHDQKAAIVARKKARDNASWESYRDGGSAGDVSGEHVARDSSEECLESQQSKRDGASVRALVASRQRTLSKNEAESTVTLSEFPRARM